MLIELLGWIGTIFAAVPFFMSNLQALRRLSIVSAFLLGTYDVLISAWPLVALSAAVITANVIGLYRERRATRVDD